MTIWSLAHYDVLFALLSVSIDYRRCCKCGNVFNSMRTLIFFARYAAIEQDEMVQSIDYFANADGHHVKITPFQEHV